MHKRQGVRPDLIIDEAPAVWDSSPEQFCKGMVAEAGCSQGVARQKAPFVGSSQSPLDIEGCQFRKSPSQAVP